MTLAITDRWTAGSVNRICEFMRIPELYWSVNDRLYPQPDERDLESWIRQPDVSTFVASWDHTIIGYVQFVRRSSVCAEMTVAYAPQWRGNCARTLTLYAMAELFKSRGILKIIAGVPTDNRAALVAARIIGMRKEGQLTKAIVREDGLRDLVVFGITKDEFLSAAKRGAN